MEIEVHQRGGVLGTDRRYLIKDGTIEVIDKGRSRGFKRLDPTRAARIDALAESAAAAKPTPKADVLVSDSMETEIAIVAENGTKSMLHLHTGDVVPAVVWDLIGEVNYASDS